jgi:hypothetical protein
MKGSLWTGRSAGCIQSSIAHGGESGQEKRSRQGILPGGHVLRPVQILHVV